MLLSSLVSQKTAYTHRPQQQLAHTHSAESGNSTEHVDTPGPRKRGKVPALATPTQKDGTNVELFAPHARASVKKTNDDRRQQNYARELRHLLAFTRV